MSRTLLFIVVTLAGIAGLLGTECNNPNEERRCVPACPPQKTCSNRDIQVSCLHQESCKDACVCKKGYFKNAGGECVTEDYCTRCGGQNEYYSCRVKPDETCASLNGTTADPAKTTADADETAADPAETTADPAECSERCYCSPGTARDENNVCVPYDQCNKPCADGETKDYCPADCSSDSCPKSERSVSCPRPAVCPAPKCRCRFNYRRADNGTCIPTRQCPPFKCHKCHEVYTACPPLCPNGYCTQATPTGRCPPLLGSILIVLECNPQCRCESGYWWNENKECIPYSQCPGKNGTTASDS